MKRYGYLWKDVIDFDNLLLAHHNARKGKTWYKEVKMVDSDPYYYIDKIYHMLNDKTYSVSPYKVFVHNDSGKERIISKLPYYPDRIIQWALIQIIEPIFINTFITDTYSAIPERGVHYGLKRLRCALNDKENTKYCLKLDVKKYYQSIPHDMLKKSLRKLFKDPDLLWLLDITIDSVGGNTGIPIGNYTSQYFGNFYLSELDHHVKENKDHTFYGRYMDDIVILHRNKKYLHYLRKEIDWYLTSKLGLRMKENWQIFPTFKRGIDFLGYRSFGDYTLLRKSTAEKFKNKMNRIILNKDIGVEKENCIASYNGWLKWCDSFRLKNKYLSPAMEVIYANNI